MDASRLLTLVRLAITNATGFAATTIVPIWIGDIATHLGTSPWFAGAAATAQLASAALMNFLTPMLFRSVSPLVLARIALCVAIVASGLQQISHPAVFFVVSMLCGAALGVVLNSTNRLIAASDAVHEGYSIFQITEVLIGGSLFGLSALAALQFGLSSVFLMVGGMCVLSYGLLHRLPVHNLVAAEPVNAPLGNRLPAVLGLAALAMFFIGQSSVNTYLIPIGRSMGFDTAIVSGAIAFSMFFGIAGAVSARLLGDRFGVVAPVGAVALLLATDFLMITQVRSFPLLVVGIGTLTFSTMFVVPYFFTLLAKLHRGGLYASIGPAFLLGGLALGPSIAVFMAIEWGIAALGAVAGLTVLLSATLFWACTRVAEREESSAVTT